MIGIPCAIAASRFTGTLLFDLTPSDPVTIVVAAAFFLVVGAAAGLLPAYRASTIDPMAALRTE